MTDYVIWLITLHTYDLIKQFLMHVISKSFLKKYKY